ncbi:MAG: FkbM family methyltransferase [Burkholderiaceae bacterium]|nr:FkbM family methyltransferase [Burkholderiaceae bacterium]
MRYPVMQQSLRLIRQIAPQAVRQVIDIGVQHRTDYLMDAFPDLHHHLFEPVSAHHAELEKNYRDRGIAYQLHKLALSDTSGTLFLHNTSADGSGHITHSHLRPARDERMKFLLNIEEIAARRLDDLFTRQGLGDLSYLVKIDVDGLEEKIIAGGADVVGGASFVAIEASLGRRDLCSRAALLEQHGFRIFDLCDHAYYYGQLALVELLMINNRLRASEIKFRPWDFSGGKVEWSKWQHGFTHLAGEPANDPFG